MGYEMQTFQEYIACLVQGFCPVVRAAIISYIYTCIWPSMGRLSESDLGMQWKKQFIVISLIIVGIDCGQLTYGGIY